MHLINIFQVALLCASQAAAVPVAESEILAPNATRVLTKRANPAPVSYGRELGSGRETKSQERDTDHLM